jgi:putative aldouronate transport system substrate-binding protein
MGRKFSRPLLAGLAISVLMGVLAACSGASGGNNTPTTKGSGDAKPASKLDTSKRVELQFYMVGDAPKDLPVIEAEVNKLALADLNTTVKFNYTTWTEYEQKYKLLLTSGQPIDLIYTATWLQYQTYAKKGAFLPLDDMLPKVTPALNKHVTPEMWNNAKIDGKIYTVPSTFKEYTPDGAPYREDLRKKYNLPKPESLETIEAYLDGIKKNEPGLTPVSDTQNAYALGLYQLLPALKNNMTGDWLKNYGLQFSYDNPRGINSYWGSPEHLEMLKLYKRWADKGFWSRNQLNATAGGHDVFASGKAAIALQGENPIRFNDSVTKIKSVHPDWEIGYFPYTDFRGFAIPNPPIGNGFAIPKSSKNSERALAFYEKLVTDKRYNLLTSYGIEGKNYKVVDGHYEMIGDSSTNGFPREGMNSWAWRNPNYMLFDKSFDQVLDMFKKMDTMYKPAYFSGFAEDYSSYQAERAALEQVSTQYLKPLEAGNVEDVEAGLKQFMEKAKAAGLEKIQKAYIEQWNKYLGEIGK